MTRPTPPERARRIGNPGKKALTVIEGAGWSLDPLPDPPPGLRRAGRAAWALCQGCAWITATDAATVLIFAQCMDDRERLRADLQAQRYVVGSTGQPRPHPAAAMLAQTEQMIERLSHSLLLTPDDRARVGVAASRAKTTLDDLLERRATRRGRR